IHKNDLSLKPGNTAKAHVKKRITIMKNKKIHTTSKKAVSQLGIQVRTRIRAGCVGCLPP
ncbi:MAG: hypothetical protein NT121_21120, partial [Chloroflexi bacterium]|nr:hypothetical protein [Chloroflexota bacterium]